MNLDLDLEEVASAFFEIAEAVPHDWREWDEEKLAPSPSTWGTVIKVAAAEIARTTGKTYSASYDALYEVGAKRYGPDFDGEEAPQRDGQLGWQIWGVANEAIRAACEG